MAEPETTTDNDNKHAVKFETKELDVSISMACWIVFCPFHLGGIPYKTTLLLDNEEVTKTDVNLCGKTVSKRPYGELGNVDRSNCFCCVGATSSFGEISPGCGCDQEKVDEVVAELKARMKKRGDTAQIQRAELTLKRLDEVEQKLDLIIDHFNIPKPESMNRE